MSDLIARLQGPDPDDCPACRTDATMAIACGRGECVALRKLRAEAAAALAAKDAEIVKWRCIGASLAHDLADVLQVLGCCDSEAAIERVATLRARLAAAETVVEAARTVQEGGMFFDGELIRALAAYDAAKEATDVG